jgi:hypothetical protein
MGGMLTSFTLVQLLPFVHIKWGYVNVNGELRYLDLCKRAQPAIYSRKYYRGSEYSIICLATSVVGSGPSCVAIGRSASLFVDDKTLDRVDVVAGVWAEASTPPQTGILLTIGLLVRRRGRMSGRGLKGHHCGVTPG